MQEVWAERADAAEGAIVSRHLRRLWGGMPPDSTRRGCLACCSTRADVQAVALLVQAHLLDTAIDALERDPTPKRRRRVAKVARSVRVRNVSAWTNNYYDDMAWLGLSLERAQRMFSVDHRTAVQALESQLFDSWSPADGGGIPWCKGSDFYNTPANGPAGIMLARTGKLWRAQATADWIDETLRDPDSGLIFDGIRRDGTLERAIYSYCQGVTLGVGNRVVDAIGRTAPPRASPQTRRRGLRRHDRVRSYHGRWRRRRRTVQRNPGSLPRVRGGEPVLGDSRGPASARTRSADRSLLRGSCLEQQTADRRPASVRARLDQGCSVAESVRRHRHLRRRNGALVERARARPLGAGRWVDAHGGSLCRLGGWIPA